eukprot:TRINITY_DN2605_c0_g2_i2.p1 TRINITY_DN2605_c0_g2~~TRINITY_DN2605_c0_g2_i2.p1  ORF type:complete len:149 (+),score=16.77 TRINITY_DN2605_c0_g2_i2:232-678(+)
MQIWDTAGQEKYNSIGNSFYKGANCCVIVFDITKPISFQSVKKWQRNFLKFADTSGNVGFPFLLIGNKTDKESDRLVHQREIEKFKTENPNMLYYETSAKDGTMVNDAFENIAKLAMKGLDQSLLFPGSATKLKLIDPPAISQKKCSC